MSILNSKFHRKLVAVFLVAIIFRGILFLNVINHPQVIFQPDSKMYVSLAKGLLEKGSLYSPDRPRHHDVDRMPGYPHKIVITIL